MVKRVRGTGSARLGVRSAARGARPSSCSHCPGLAWNIVLAVLFALPVVLFATVLLAARGLETKRITAQSATPRDIDTSRSSRRTSRRSRSHCSRRIVPRLVGMVGAAGRSGARLPARRHVLAQPALRDRRLPPVPGGRGAAPASPGRCSPAAARSRRAAPPTARSSHRASSSNSGAADDHRRTARRTHRTHRCGTGEPRRQRLPRSRHRARLGRTTRGDLRAGAGRRGALRRAGCRRVPARPRVAALRPVVSTVDRPGVRRRPRRGAGARATPVLRGVRPVAGGHLRRHADRRDGARGVRRSGTLDRRLPAQGPRHRYPETAWRCANCS